jgi:exonuclease SbcC
MIEQMRKLCTYLRSILLVSHEEEFADAFADGYRLELADGSARVTGFQR